jgi:hypothetical protein
VRQEKIEPPVEVTLLRGHKHAGKFYAAGEKIFVTRPEREWLIANDVVAKEGAA